MKTHGRYAVYNPEDPEGMPSPDLYVPPLNLYEVCVIKGIYGSIDANRKFLEEQLERI